MTGLAIVGTADVVVNEAPAGTTPFDLMAQASIAALDDAGLKPRDVDGVMAAGLETMMPTLSLSEYLGLHPRYSDGTQIGGGAFIAFLNHARAVLAAGLAHTILIAYGSTQRSARGGFASAAERNRYDAPGFGHVPAVAYALCASRHIHLYGTTSEQLAGIAVAARRWAALNPRALRRDPITVGDVLAARRVAEPFGVLDCCPATDGAGAIVVTTAERAADLARRPVRLLGAGEAVSHRTISQMPDLTTTLATASGGRAFAEAGLKPADIDVVQLYDAFTINPILFAEDLGFCAKGEGGAFLSPDRIGPGGDFPLNTSGGGLAYCHPGMFGIFTITEAVRQLRGAAGDAQVAGARTALVHGPGGFMSSQSTAILGI